MHPRLATPALLGGLLALVAAPALAQGNSAPQASPSGPPTQQPAATSGYNGGFVHRLFQAYYDELNPPAIPPAPAADAPPTHRGDPFPPAPVTYPPYPFTDWPYGGSTTIGAGVPNAVTSPLMTALAPTEVGQFLTRNNIQVYGWLAPGFNISTNHQSKNGNAPAAYFFDPNTVLFNQGTLYVERVPDTVQQDHIDWGFRITGLYGSDYRYTTSRGITSYQLLKGNHQYGTDLPMVYGEIYFPNVAQGMVVRVGRYISVPDIEAQLAPNNYMYSHSMLYTFDPYTNIGAVATVQLDRNWLVQGGITGGNDVAPWQGREPGVQPSGTACLRYNTNSSNDNIYGCANSFNGANWGYNNLQQYVLTYYHRFNERIHISMESWYMYQRNVPNVNVTGGDYTNTPFAGLRNPPNQAVCNTGNSCRAQEFAALAYLNFLLTPNDNLSLRAELFDDMQGQRTGYRTRYVNGAIGVQHYFSPSIYIRPEVAYYNAIDGATPFDNGRHRSALIVGGDLIFRF